MKRIRKTRGLLTKIADDLGIRLAAVSVWARVPGHRVEQVEKITGISRTELRPDLFPSHSETGKGGGHGGSVDRRPRRTIKAVARG